MLIRLTARTTGIKFNLYGLLMHTRWDFQGSWQHGLGNGIQAIVYLLQRMYGRKWTRLSFVNI